MKTLLFVLLLSGCGDDPALCFGRPAPTTMRCCPNRDRYGLPFGSCSPIGDACEPSASDSFCACEATGWQCHSHLLPDLAVPNLGD